MQALTDRLQGWSCRIPEGDSMCCYGGKKQQKRGKKRENKEQKPADRHRRPRRKRVSVLIKKGSGSGVGGREEPRKKTANRELAL